MKNELIKLLDKAYAPYSNFHVAAIILMKDGKYIPGVNVENASYGATLCAERNAITTAVSMGYKKGDFEKIFKFITKQLKSSGNLILSGDINASPVDGVDGDACKYCDFAAICRMRYEEHTKVPRMKNTEVMNEIERQVNEDGV